MTNETPFANFKVNPYLIFDKIPDALFLLDSDHKFIYLNAKAEELSGLGRQLAIQQSIYDLFTDGNDIILTQLLIKVLSFNDKRDEEFYSDTHEKWFKITGYHSGDGFAIFLSDINDEKNVFDKLRQKERKLREFFDNLPHIAFISVPQSQHIILNRKGREYTDEKLITDRGESWKNIIHPDDQRSYINNWVKSKFNLTTLEGEYRLKSKTGEYRWFRGEIIPLKGDKDVVYAWIGTFTDVNEQKLAEKELKESEYRMWQVEGATLDIVNIINIKDYSFTYINNQFMSYFGIDSKNLKNLKLSWVKLKIKPESVSAFVDFYRKIELSNDNEIREFEVEAKDGKGRWRWLKIRAKVYSRTSAGEVSHVISVIHDIDDKFGIVDNSHEVLELKDIIQRKEEVLNIVSHELKTPITSIKASLQILKRLAANQIDEKTLLVFINRTNQQVNKLFELVKDLPRDMEEPGELRLTLSPFDMKEVIAACINYSNTSDAGVIVRNTLKDLVVADKNKIEQVIVNYITNAHKYSQGNDVYIDIKKEDNYLYISVADKGIGISEEAQKMVFDRYYRVSRSTEIEGQGLGLYISAEIIKLHKGFYGVVSEVGKGSTFWFKIPLVP